MPLPEEEVVKPRFDERMSITSTDKGKIVIRMVDRINVDDVFLHLVHREIFRLSSGVDPGTDVKSVFKEFLLKERFTLGQS